MNYLGVGISPLNNTKTTKMNLIDRKVKLTELFLRCSVCAFTFIAAILIATDVQVKEIFMIQKKAKYTDMKALVFMVVVSGVVAAYSLMHVVRCVMGLRKGRGLVRKSLAWAIFSGDQAIAYLCVVAVATASQSAVFAELGEPELQWMKICNMYGKFCNQVGAGIASGLVASIGLVLISSISAFGVFRLYGGLSKAQRSSLW